MSSDLISDQIEEEIVKIELLRESLNSSYAKARKEIE
jgi:hypothetical protein